MFHCTEQVSRDGSFKVDVLGTVLVVELAAYKGMQVLVQRLNGPVQFLKIFLKGLRLIPRAPVISSVCKT